jgi:hypothetical protein
MNNITSDNPNQPPSVSDDNPGQPQEQQQRILPENLRRRMRSVAEREASRLARPAQLPQKSLSHASRLKSAVTSTPTGIQYFSSTAIKSATSSALDSNSGRTHGEEWCGPFSVARMMIAAREEARLKREREIQMQEEDEENKKEQHPLDLIVRETTLEQKIRHNPSLVWKGKAMAKDDKDETGKKQNLYYKRQRRYKEQKQQSKKRNAASDDDGALGHSNIPSLFDLCIKFIVENFENVEALGVMVDSTIRRKICEQLVTTGTFNGAAFDTLAEEGIETLEITDCTQVTQDQMVEALEKLIPSGLRALILTYCGRCFGTKAVDAIVNHSSLLSENHNNLFAVSISGAYLLKDFDAARLVACSARTLSSIEFKACPLLGSEFCKQVAMSFDSRMNPAANPLLELSLQDVPLSREHLHLLLQSDALRHLRNISLRHVESLDDLTLFSILEATQGNLEGIDLSHDIHLTDDALSSIRCCNSKGKLKSLQLSGIKNFTAAGLEAFFTFGIDGLRNPPTLRTLDLSDCSYDSVNETVVNLAIAASAVKQTVSELDGKKEDKKHHSSSDLSALGGIVSLDVSGSSVTDKTMEELATFCSSTLRDLRMNFCPLVSDKGLGYLVEKCGNQFVFLDIWGNAQISDTFLDGHDRIGKGLVIEGAWMKHSSGRGSI